MRKLLYIFYIPLLLINWVCDTLTRLFKSLTDCLEELALSLKTEIENEPAIQAKSNEGPA